MIVGDRVSGPRLTVTERAQIEVLFGQGLSFPQIAARIGRDRSTVWREVTRNNAYRGNSLAGAGARHPRGSRAGAPGWGGAYRWVYSHAHAHRRALKRARRPRAMKLRPGWGKPYPALWHVVAAKLRCRWSPQQISAWLKTQYPQQPEKHVSHETIYQAIYYQARGGMRQELARQVALRTGRSQRRSQSREAKAGRGAKPWTVDFNISSRPVEAADRAVPGHWEGDLVLGARGSSAIITLVERSTRFVMLGSLPTSRVSQEVIRVLIEQMRQLPEHLRASLTWDQGAEMSAVADFRLATDCEVYFCDPHAPWQRGTNENTNGLLLRQYFPRSTTDFRTISQTELDAVAAELNARPRKTLKWKTPAQALHEHLVATTP